MDGSCTDQFTWCCIQVMQYVESAEREKSHEVIVDVSGKGTESEEDLQGKDMLAQNNENGTHEDEISPIQTANKTNKPGQTTCVETREA